ncbi:MAG: PH domain-containing protein [Eubacteriales bacterium]|nr:PH domain-containing protein [Eubacteriales bacterium]
MGRQTQEKDAKGTLMFTERKRWLFFALPFTFTKYLIYENDIQIESGLLTTKENDCYMYRVSDVELTRTLFQKIFGIGTVRCFTSDVTDKNLILKNIRNSREIKDYIYKAAEDSKKRRRTINMQDIGADAVGALGDE